MPAKPKPEPVEFAAKFSADDAIKNFQKMGTGWGKEMNQIGKKSDRTMKGSFKAVKEFYFKSGGAQKAYSKVYEKTLKKENHHGKELRAALKNNNKLYKQQLALVKENEKRTKSGEGLFDPAAMKKSRLDLDKSKKDLEAITAKRERLNDAMEQLHVGSQEIKTRFEFDPGELDDAAQEAGETFLKPIKMGIVGIAEFAVQRTASRLGGLLARAGGGLAKRAAAREEAGGKGGMMGKAMNGIASALKAIGPALSMVGGLVAGMIQLFLDADAAAKDFNKEILSTSGNAEFLYKNMHNVNAATADLGDTLSDIYSQATELSNLKWGLKASDYSATLNALTAEGQSLEMLKDKYKAAKGEASSWGGIVKMSVGYSRAFGVSLQEIGALEGEMMTELGSNLDEVETSFQYMIRGAEEAGIATNKFFNIIRGFSADLTLFNVRMDSVTKMMMALGKAMSPREAQKFLQGLTGFFKGKGLGERSADVLMAGQGNTAANQQDQLNSNLDNLIKKIEKDTGKSPSRQDLKKLLAKDAKTRMRETSTDLGKLSDDTTRAMDEAAVFQSRVMKGGVVDLASNLADLDPMHVYNQVKSMVKGVIGKPIEQLTDVERLGAESAVHVSDEQQKMFEKMRMGILHMQEDLARKLELGLDLTDAEHEALKRLGIDAKSANAAEAIRAADDTKIWDAMSADQQAEAAGGKKEMTFEQKAASVQVSIKDQIDILTGWLMRTFFQAIMGIWGTIKKLSILGDPAADMQIEVGKSGNRELMDIAESSKNDAEFMEQYNKSDAAAKIASALLTSADTTDKKNAKSGKDIAAKQAQAMKAVASNFTGTGDQLVTAMEAAKNGGAKIDAGQMNIAKEAFRQNGDVLKALNGLDTDTQAKVLEKLRLSMSPGQLAKATQDSTITPKSMAAATTEGQDKSEESKKATTSGSIFTHDIHTEGALVDLVMGVGGLEAGVDDLNDGLEDVGGTLDDIYRALRMRGIKIDKPFLNSHVKRVLKDATYEAAGDALMDYYILQQADSGQVMDVIKKGADAKTIQHALATGMQGTKKTQGKDARDILAGIELPNHQAGGMVSAIQNGMAVVRPSPGEGLASVGKGETIGRAGGGGQVIELRLKGDLARIIDARAHNAIADSERMKTRR